MYCYFELLHNSLTWLEYHKIAKYCVSSDLQNSGYGPLNEFKDVCCMAQ
jgi:hypothetical protein